MRSELVVGDVPTFFGGVVDVLRGETYVLLTERGSGHALVFGDGDLSALRELLDRAAMPGQNRAVGGG